MVSSACRLRQQGQTTAGMTDHSGIRYVKTGTPMLSRTGTIKLGHEATYLTRIGYGKCRGRRLVTREHELWLNQAILKSGEYELHHRPQTRKVQIRVPISSSVVNSQTEITSSIQFLARLKSQSARHEFQMRPAVAEDEWRARAPS